MGMFAGMFGRHALLATALGAVLVAPLSGHARSGSVEEPVAPAIRVLVISVDGLKPAALRKLGRQATPNFHRLKAEGAFTLNARSQVERTTTLPNHTSMVTGHRINRRSGGHGVTWNSHIPGSTVHRAAGHPVGSIFSVLNDEGLDAALFASKRKFSIFDRSWPGIDRVTIKEAQDLALTKAARADLIRRHRAFTFLHLGGPDRAGHARGFGSDAYLTAVRRADNRVGKILAAVDAHDALDDLTIVLTADHGGAGRGHSDRTRLANYRVPFVVWGPGVTHDNLYDLNPAYLDPGKRRVAFSGGQPIRNGDVANFSADLLGIGPVPDSLWNYDQELRVN